MHNYTMEYLELIGKYAKDIAIPKYGNRSSITYYELINSILITTNLVEAAHLLNMEDKTIQRHLKKLFPNISLMGALSWKKYLLSCLSIKQCSTCKKYMKIKDNFYILDSGQIISSCKKCESIRNAKNRALRNLRIPNWITEEDYEKISEIYKKCPKGYHVDHIIPLQGKLVSGFHTPNNLQYLTVEENLKKYNKYTPL